MASRTAKPATEKVREKVRGQIRKKPGEEVAGQIRVIPIPVQGEIHAGERLAERLSHAVRSAGVVIKDGDILVVKHKVVSKSEGALIALDTVRSSKASRVWAARHGLDARVSELALRESRRIVRRKRGVLITGTRHGFVCANSGVDVSNVDGGKHAVLLPQNPDHSADRLRRAFKKSPGVEIAVIISDSFGRPWREGLTEVAIGVSGMQALVDYRGRRDPHGYSLHATVDAVADELACAAGLVCGKLAGTPACIIRGYAYERDYKNRSQGARALIRPAKNDLFR